MQHRRESDERLMPELPEVEITRRGIAPVLRRRTVTTVTVRNPRLRWRVPAGLAATLLGTRIRAVRRREAALALHGASPE